jgi:D-glycero-alpha-D-manno-heptose 1-phosphate guanylyltransferase
MIKQAIILAGGLGTRLRSVVSELPKCMAPIAGKPFLHYVLAHLTKEGISDYVFSVGYKSENILDYLNDTYGKNTDLRVQFSSENEPLGTGGAIQLALEKVTEENVLICNGDTLFKVNVEQLNHFHTQHKADCSLSLKPMKHFDRYGAVVTDQKSRITSFEEKRFNETGLINGGFYLLNAGNFRKETFPIKFSFEKDYLEKNVEKRKLYGLVQDEYFIDIGIPEDYSRAQSELLNY